MEFRDVVARRRMVRHFADEPVSRETLGRIAAIAQRAPSVIPVGRPLPDRRSPSLRRGRITREEFVHWERW